MAYKILVADDDRLLRELLTDVLEQEGYEVLAAEDGIRALEYFKNTPELSLAILDILMPGRDGLSVLQDIHGERPDLPVIMLTALGSSESELEGFERGACDYVAKPFHSKVLLARIRAALEYKTFQEKRQKLWVEGDLTVNRDSCTVQVCGKEVVLTNKEYQLLVYLMENRNIVLTRNQILERIWGFDYEGDIRTIDTHIKMLRTDLGECGNYIRTVRGIGYSFQKEGSSC
ncbi:MAG: response regulator transcription factor [Eubacteriales bacterium]|nr:response regulator transcription factor [Eubacteriales bacterium]